MSTKTWEEIITDEIFELVKSRLPALMPEKVAKAGIRQTIDAMIMAGYRVLAPGFGPSPYEGRREPVEIKSDSVFCPHCGKHKPPIGVQVGGMQVDGFGTIATCTIFCGECRAIMTVSIAHVEPPGDVQ